MAKSAKSLTLLLATILLFACGEQAEVVEVGPVEMPADHDIVAKPESKPQGPRQVVMPEALQGKYQSATMTVQLPGATEVVTIELPLNGEPQQTDYGTLLARDYLPAFLISGNTITSEGIEEKNPAVWAEWQNQGQTVFAGWLFRDYPSLNPMQLPDHQLTFIGVK
ncbi:MAG: hypothetical protein ABFS08_03985 [Pseudomonadota bacterium]